MLKLSKKDYRKKSKDEIIEELFELYEEKEKLERELKKYKNAHTPSSSNKHIKPNTQGTKAKKGAKRGAPKGHRGATLHLPPADEIVPVPAKECTHCHSKNVVPTGYTKERPLMCLKKPEVIVKKFLQEEIKCLDCFAISLAKHNDLPEKGLYDKTIQSLVNYFRFKARLPHNKIVDVMNTIFNVPMTGPTSLEITKRASKKLAPYYKELEKQIKKSNIVNADETSHSVGGVNHWIWVFCNAFISVFKFDEKRSGDIVEKTLGDEFGGTLVVDGWTTYKTYSKNHKQVLLQRCWSHGLREVKAECKEKHPDLYKWYCDIYAMAKKGKRYKQEKRRHTMFQKCKAELAMWVTLAIDHENLYQVANKIENGGDDWFTAILYPAAPLDNNEAERSLRPLVVMRKIIGCLRSEEGVRTHEVMMSLFSTWEKQQKEIFSMLEASL